MTLEGHSRRSIATAATSASIRIAASFFDITADDLAKLHVPQGSPQTLWSLGGTDGLFQRLHSHPASGLGKPATRDEGADGALPDDEDESNTLLPFAERRRQFGDNRLPQRRQDSFLQMMWGAYNDPVLFLLTAAAAVSLAIGIYQNQTTVHTVDNPPFEWAQGVAILAAVVIIVLASAINDWEKARQFKKLYAKQAERFCKVVRFGQESLTSTGDVLVGDVVLLEPGDMIPADGILFEGQRVICNESARTGETVEVFKDPAEELMKIMRRNPEMMAGRDDPLQKHDPFLVCGSLMKEGVGKFVVTATGRNSTLGRVLADVRNQDKQKPTPLQERLAVLAKYISYAGIAISAVLFLALFIKFLVTVVPDSRPSTEKGKAFVDIVIIALTVLVIAVPEGLPLAVTLSLAYATTRMLQDKNLVRKLKSCEIMANVNSICSDKTGTLTQNVMVVSRVLVGMDFPHHSTKHHTEKGSLLAADGPSASGSNPRLLDLSVQDLLRQSISLNTTAFEDDTGSFVGLQTETALLAFARSRLGMGPLRQERGAHDIVQLIPFKGGRPYMAVVIRLHGRPNSFRVFAKGAPEILLERCGRLINEPSQALSTSPLEKKQRDAISDNFEQYTQKALRVIGLAYREFEAKDGPANSAGANIEFELEFLLRDLVFLGLVGIHDPIRPGVAESIRTCGEAGVQVRMVTGDNLQTAMAIAQSCGILSDPTDISLEGAEFRAMADVEKAAAAPRIKVLARTSPEDKKELVQLLQARNEIVAVTGDGINDAMAMIAADVSFSMGGLSGTDIAREASSIVLLTDDFASIVKAISWGRAVNDATRKFLVYQITITVTSVLLAFVSAISDDNQESVLSPVQLMWINLFQDTLAALALATDKPQPRVLDRKPDPKSSGLITVPMWKTIIGQSTYQLVVTFVLFFAGNKLFNAQTALEKDQVRTLVFNAYVFMGVANMLNSRQHDNTLQVWEGMLSNALFLCVTSLVIGVQVLLIFVGGQALPAAHLTWAQWLVSVFAGALTIPVGMLIRLLPDGPFDAAFRVFVGSMEGVFSTVTRRCSRGVGQAEGGVEMASPVRA